MSEYEYVFGWMAGQECKLNFAHPYWADAFKFTIATTVTFCVRDQQSWRCSIHAIPAIALGQWEDTNKICS